MDWADDLTYSVHDLDDFFRARKIPLHLLADRRYDRERSVFFEAVAKRHDGEKGTWSDYQALREAFNEVMVGLFPLRDNYAGTWLERASLREFTSQLIGRYMGGTSIAVQEDRKARVHVDDHLLLEVAMLKELTWVYIIEAPSLISQQYGQRQVIKKLFEIYMDAASCQKHRNLFPPYYRQALEDAEQRDDKTTRRTVIDLIAGMTEEQALAVHNRLLGVSLGSGLEELLS